MIRAFIVAVVAVLGASACQEHHSLSASVTVGTSDHKDELSPGTKWQKGVQYDLIAPGQSGTAQPAPSSAPVPAHGHKIQVVEFFWYGCPHCYTLEPHLVLWNKRKQDDVEFVRVPAAWYGPNRVLARLYYTLRALGKEDLHEEVFDTIHRRDNLLDSVNNDAAEALKLQTEFAQSHGIDAPTFLRTYNSPAIDTAVREAEQLALRYQVTGVPTIVVDGKFRTSLRQVGGCERDLTTLLDEIVKHERGG